MRAGPDIQVVIPARYASVRLPGKPLRKVGEKTLLQRVYEAARIATVGLDADVLIATDHDRIAEHAAQIGAQVVMTDSRHVSGTDRVWEAVNGLRPRPGFVVNVQGDLALLPPHVIRAVVVALTEQADSAVVTPAVQLTWSQLSSLTSHKEASPTSGTTVVVNQGGYAMWFSKAVIPRVRTAGTDEPSALSPVHRHIGIYGYSTEHLARFKALSPGHYETIEGLEQLRFLENQIPIRVVPTFLGDAAAHSGIDTEEDLRRASAWLDANPDPQTAGIESTQ